MLESVPTGTGTRDNLELKGRLHLIIGCSPYVMPDKMSGRC